MGSWAVSGRMDGPRASTSQSRSYCSVERESEGETEGGLSIHPQLTHTLAPPSFHHHHQLQSKLSDAGRGCGLFGHSWCTGCGPWQRSDLIKHHWSSCWIPPSSKQNKTHKTRLWLRFDAKIILYSALLWYRARMTLFKHFSPLLLLLPHTVAAYKTECSI